MLTYIAYLLLLAAGIALYFAAQRNEPVRSRAWIGYLLIAGAIGLLLWAQSEPQKFLSDFHKAYYNAGRLVHGDPDALYDAEPLEFVNLPLVGYVFTPLTWLPRKVAGGIVTLFGFGVVIIAWVLLAALGRLSERRALLLGVLFVISGPLYNSLREGNATHFVLLGLVLVLWFADARRYALAGGILALCVIMKPPLGYLILPFVVRGRWSGVAGFVGTLALFAAVSLAVIGWGPHERWYERVVEPYQQHPLGAFNVQSADGFLARLLEGGDYLTDWSPIEDISGAFGPLRFGIVALLLLTTAGVWWFSRRDEGDHGFAHDMAILLVLSMVVGPITWSHYYAQMLIPFALLLGTRMPLPGDRIWTAWFALIVVLGSLPVIQFAPDRPLLDELVPRLFVSHFFYAGILMLALLLALRVRLAMRTAPATERESAPAGVREAAIASP
jgi:hypothetical protein